MFASARPSVLDTLALPIPTAGQLTTLASAFAALDSPETPTTGMAVAKCLKTNARRTPSAAKWNLANRTAPESAAVFPSARRFVAATAPSAWPTTTQLNAPARRPAFTPATHPERKVVARSNVWLMAIALGPSRATAPLTRASPSAFKTVAAKTPSVWPKTTWPCVPAPLD